jgi:tRNA nucleotidyltransferase (CCA-adding enzyme)
MQIYLVGGAVRDRLLGLPPGERDWVVVGATPGDMAANGFKPVGRDFPVFLHPETKEEYALARTERKTAPGYHGFVFHADPGVTLEDDLRRRDLTVNAIAEDSAGALLDPYGGQRDIGSRVLRHVSPAFAEDPVRILRVARFYSRFKPLGFHVAEETLALMRAMVADGEVDALQPERVWQETRRSLAQADPAAYFELLRDCGALARLFPELDALFGVPQTAKHHPEIDTGVHVLMALTQAAHMQSPVEVIFAVLCHDFGKALTPPAVLPHHYGHEARGVARVRQFCERLRVPTDYRELALIATQYHLLVHQALQLRPSTVVELLERTRAFQQPARFDQFLQACAADARGRLGLESREYPQAAYLREALDIANTVSTDDILSAGISGKAVGEALKKKRCEALAAWHNSRKPGSTADED